MVLCTYCGQITDATEKPKSCAKCRSVTYCNTDCQKADWNMHKTCCRPCPFYVIERVVKLNASGQWRKLVKWRPYLEKVLTGMRLVTAAHPDKTEQVDMDMIKMRRIFVEAYKLGITSTNDPDDIYARAAVPLLQDLVDLQGNHNMFADQGASLCDLASMERNIAGYYNQDAVAYFRRAYAIGLRHNIRSLIMCACIGLETQATESEVCKLISLSNDNKSDIYPRRCQMA